jgi:hypothetical protein
VGADAKGLSAITITRLKGIWENEYAAWSRRSLESKRYSKKEYAPQAAGRKELEMVSMLHHWWPNSMAPT